MLKSKDIILFSLIVVLTIGLVLISSWTDEIVLFDHLSKAINKQILYQAITLFGTTIFLFLLWRTKRTVFREYFRKGDISAEIVTRTDSWYKTETR